MKLVLFKIAPEIDPMPGILTEGGIYMGPDSTNPEAVRRHRPAGAG